MKLTITLDDVTSADLRDAGVLTEELEELLRRLNTRKRDRRTLRVATQITDDQILKLKVSGTDRDGEPASIGALSTTRASHPPRSTRQIRPRSS